ncbi:hypothetical protein ALP96_03877 [Pseudomonas savastanoi pv. glycinea]|uniref:hypothetical protein n=2 Tax=Pseudomonas savastanoi TaxID=29438 RepID=UPI000F00B616|nr:hypothetical protein [Pseudomonas savastanoi]RMP90680.1 hypothetical protein ALQ13_02664 [Pseudomonas savastanoi pv. glycinea]RMQ87125.1 hypothetical protein ALP95_02971 [Pseudomonas savastanoi pv. glycinea]RMQ90071.1 hypothetical protein ALP96_03877 [Pseudomonas savastanoi pv. glycinea]
MNNKFTIPSFIAIVGISGFFALLIALAYSLHLQGYVPNAFTLPILETIELSQLKKFLWYGFFYFSGLAFAFSHCAESAKNQKAEENSKKGLGVSICASVLIAFCTSFSAPYSPVQESAVEAAQQESLKNSVDKLDPLSNYMEDDGDQKSFFTKEVTLNEIPILDLSNVPLTAIAALWLVLFCFFNRYLRDSKVCEAGKPVVPKIGMFAELTHSLYSKSAKYSDEIGTAILCLIVVSMLGYAVWFFINNSQFLLPFCAALSFLVCTLTIMVKMYQYDDSDYGVQTICQDVDDGKAKGCEDDCECILCTRTDEEEFDDLYDFIESKGLETEFEAYQTLRDEERGNRKAW